MFEIPMLSIIEPPSNINKYVWHRCMNNLYQKIIEWALDNDIKYKYIFADLGWTHDIIQFTSAEDMLLFKLKFSGITYNEYID